MEKIFRIVASNTVVRDHAVMVHVVDASAAAAAMMNACMFPDNLALATALVKFRGLLREELLAWKDVAGVRVVDHDQAVNDLYVKKDLGEAKRDALEAPSTIWPGQV